MAVTRHHLRIRLTLHLGVDVNNVFVCAGGGSRAARDANGGACGTPFVAQRVRAACKLAWSTQAGVHASSEQLCTGALKDEREEQYIHVSCKMYLYLSDFDSVPTVRNTKSTNSRVTVSRRYAAENGHISGAYRLTKYSEQQGVDEQPRPSTRVPCLTLLTHEDLVDMQEAL